MSATTCRASSRWKGRVTSSGSWRSKGGRIALATDCKGLSFTRHMLLLDSRDYITATACGDDLEHGKPDPRLVGIALRKLGLAASQTVMVGDTPYDAEAGIEAGTKAAGVLTGGLLRRACSREPAASPWHAICALFFQICFPA